MSAFIHIAQGFFAACELMNGLSTSLLQDMASSLSLSSSTSSLSVNFYKLYIASVKKTDNLLNASQITGILNALQYILDQIVLSKVTDEPSITSLLQEHTSLSDEAISIIAGGITNVFTSQASSTSNFSLSKIVDCQWKLGMGVASNTCNHLRAPFVTLMFKINDGNGVKNQPVELTIAQFQQFHNSLLELSHAMEDV